MVEHICFAHDATAACATHRSEIDVLLRSNPLGRR
jgi:hypothetical protein